VNSFITKSRVDRVGKRIRRAARAGAQPEAKDLAVVDEFRTLHVPIVDEIQRSLVTKLHKEAELPEARYPVTSRLKTAPSIVAKLRRSKTALSRMGDISGARIVVPSLDLQDVTTEFVSLSLPQTHPR
jgi:ppGpp synthetase/RelA/SpoT-type nucleotidyltranferase